MSDHDKLAFAISQTTVAAYIQKTRLA